MHACMYVREPREPIAMYMCVTFWGGEGGSGGQWRERQELGLVGCGITIATNVVQWTDY